MSMKYDYLNQVYDQMKQELSPNTAKKYYSSLNKLFQPIQFSTPEEISLEWIESRLAGIGTKNEFSAAKNGLKFWKRCYPRARVPTEEFFRSCSLKKRNRSKKPKKYLSLKDTRKKIRSVSNEKLRLSYELAMDSGLRVSELADLTKSDLEFTENGLNVRVKKGKGGAGGIVECLPDEKLEEDLGRYTQNLGEDEKLFFSKEYMMQTAKKHGFECHDLRRIFAQRKRKEFMEKMPTKEANEEVQKSLRHARFSTTKRYLFNRKLIFDDMEEDNVR